VALLWPACGPDLANRSGPPKGRHSTLHVDQIIFPHVPDVGQIWAETMLLSGVCPSVQKLNHVRSKNIYLPPTRDRSVDLPMMRYDLPCSNLKCSLKPGRAKNGLTFPSTFLSSVPTYRDIQTSATVQELHALNTCILIYVDGHNMVVMNRTFFQRSLHLHVVDGRVLYQIHIQYLNFINCQ